MRITTADHDFIDLDWLANDQSRLALLCHGLEGDSNTHYMQGMAHACADAGWDVVAYHYRGCSGEANRLARVYHSGATDDLSEVIEQILSTHQYDQIVLIGFSLGAIWFLNIWANPTGTARLNSRLGSRSPHPAICPAAATN